jgi:hypothetical protein
MVMSVASATIPTAMGQQRPQDDLAPRTRDERR